ncbi:hypothetical protein ACE1MS_19290 [Lysinibacillus sp. fkY74-1]|uniref:Uncharacterized protein n=3 Tax=Lysinibacillus TaxID=400634 RepID=W7RVB5_LYSSH|nr:MULTISPECIES: hypothetical protein [Lysinibacillus]MBE5085943.1 hypothetical protein [Bacillus thuringiensis]ACA37953.1 hypothetical protein Bsph_0324 [Lysinibacillus sphaericus C3-41]AMO32135.1 hypothetical protein AR327_06415 [Lysinibacillus sphaericus]AMR88745.1 hypothetical protein A1T07_00250 [Lysinibacillus sphaericus]ANA46816.1 hypothetical protein A2J09_15460 [Lysinibacillus sphaericus]
MMHTIALVFLCLIERVSELETSAYILIPTIVWNMFAHIFGFHLLHEAFFIILIAAFLLSSY